MGQCCLMGTKLQLIPQDKKVLEIDGSNATDLQPQNSSGANLMCIFAKHSKQ